MRVLLDENVPVQLKRALTGLDVRSINDPDVGWKGIKDGDLLARMQGRFDILVTADRFIPAQQNLAGHSVAILVLPSNRRREVLALAPAMLQAVPVLRPGRLALVGIDGRIDVVATHR